MNVKEKIAVEIDANIIVVTVYENGGLSVCSDLHEYLDDEDDEAYNTGIDVIEALVMAHVSQGIDVTSKAYRKGLDIAIEGLANNI